jgi:hypothetical protein
VGWAFWRSWARSEPAQERPLPEDVGLPAAPSSPAAAGQPDQGSEPSDRSVTSPFSGASPDAASAHVRGDTSPTVATDGPMVLDPATAARDAAVVAAAVRGVLAGDVATVDGALSALQDEPARRAAAALATQALAARLPALSGVTGEVVFDEPADELLHAYADLLSERAEPLRRRVASALRDAISAVAHLAAAAAAAQDAGQDRSDAPMPVQPPGGFTGVQTGLVLAGVAPRHQLLAACVLLAQTCRDGGGDADALAAELTALAGETPG